MSGRYVVFQRDFPMNPDPFGFPNVVNFLEIDIGLEESMIGCKIKLIQLLFVDVELSKKMCTLKLVSLVLLPSPAGLSLPLWK